MERRKIKRVLKVIIIVCLVLITGYFALNTIIQKKIRQQFTNLSPSLVIKFSAIHVNILSSFASFDSLDINFIPYDSLQQNKHHLYFSNVSLKEIGFLKFLFSKKLEAAKLLLDDGNIELDSFLLDKKDSAQSKVFNEIKWPFNKLYFKNVELKNTRAFLHSEDSSQQLANADMIFRNVSINKPGEQPSFDEVQLVLSDLNYKSPGYQVRLPKLTISSNKKILELDSLHVSGPDHNEFTIESLRMKGFDVMQLLNERILAAKSLTIDRGRIAFFKNEEAKIPSPPFELKKIRIDNLQGKDLSVLYKDKTNEYRFIADVSLNEADIDPLFEMNKTKFGSVRGEISGFHFSGDNYRNVEIKKIDVNSTKELVEVNDINITPRIGKYEFGKRLGYQADWMQAYVSKVDIIKPDFHKLFDQKLFADKIRISESKAYIFRDRRLPRPQKNIPLPVDILKSLPIDVRVKTCELATSAVVYEEYPKSGYGKTGILRIERINLTWSPLINHPTASDPAYMTINVDGSVMGSGTTHGVIMMPLQKNKPYYIRGAFEKLELTKLNSSSENLGKIRIKSGFLDFLSFDFTMTEQRSTGKIVGAYHRLIIQQLKKHTDEKNVADFASFVLRHAIIPLNKDASLPERKRTGKVAYQRDPTRMVSYYYLQSLLMGVKKSFTLGFLLPK
ncbi:MAG TPA: hypothetical protein VGQ53_17185 [Chitinophagaceae bacterium]|nr:hypothetical protein [Chitinophagaceae bacterium]